MSQINLVSGIKETGAFLLATALSIGPSQIFGCVKLLIDSSLLGVETYRKHKINSNIKKIDGQWDTFKNSSTVSHIAEKLGIAQSTIDQENVRQYLNTKNRKKDAAINKLFRSLKADVSALIPLLGAHLSWRIATNYKGMRFTPLFSCAVEQLFEHSKTTTSRILFFGRIPKKANKSANGNIRTLTSVEVLTSTVRRNLQIYHRAPNRIFDNMLWSGEPKKAPTVILFHPNGGDAESMSEHAECYREKGYNTLSFSLGGYTGSPGVTTSEKSMYQDIEAIKIYLAKQGVKQVAYHGFSLGCSAALQAAVGDTNVKFETMFVVLDKPFTSAAAVGDNVAGFIGKGLLKAACPVDVDVELPGGLWTKTDGLNNLSKVPLLEEETRLICIEAEKDFLMGRRKKKGAYTENFAKDLFQAREAQNKSHLVISGNHNHSTLLDSHLWKHHIPELQDPAK